MTASGGDPPDPQEPLAASARLLLYLQNLQARAGGLSARRVTALIRERGEGPISHTTVNKLLTASDGVGKRSNVLKVVRALNGDEEFASELWTRAYQERHGGSDLGYVVPADVADEVLAELRAIRQILEGNADQ